MKECYGKLFGGLPECIDCSDSELCSIRYGDINLDTIETVLFRLSLIDRQEEDVTDKIFELYPEQKEWKYRALISLRLAGKTFKDISIEMQFSLYYIMKLMNDIDLKYPSLGYAMRRLTLWESSRMFKKPKVQS